MVVYHHSKWVAAVPIKNKKSSTIIHAFKFQIFPFLPRIPTNLLTDNDPEFISSEFFEFLHKCNVNYKFTTPFCPTSNGAVERVNQIITPFRFSFVALLMSSSIGTSIYQKPLSFIITLVIQCGRNTHFRQICFAVPNFNVIYIYIKFKNICDEPRIF